MLVILRDSCEPAQEFYKTEFIDSLAPHPLFRTSQQVRERNRQLLIVLHQIQGSENLIGAIVIELCKSSGSHHSTCSYDIMLLCGGSKVNFCKLIKFRI